MRKAKREMTLAEQEREKGEQAHIREAGEYGKEERQQEHTNKNTEHEHKHKTLRVCSWCVCARCKQPCPDSVLLDSPIYCDIQLLHAARQR